MASTTFFIIGGVLLVIGLILIIITAPKKTITHETWHKVLLYGGIILALIGAGMLVWGFIKRSKEKKLSMGIELAPQEYAPPVPPAPQVQYVMQAPPQQQMSRPTVQYVQPQVQPQAQPVQYVMAQPQGQFQAQPSQYMMM